MTPQMIAALSSGRAMLTGFFELDLPSGTRRLMLGSSEVAWNGYSWLGYDSTIGAITAQDDVSEDLTGQAPNTSLDINVSPTADRAAIAGSAVQLSAYKCWLVALQLDVNSNLTVVPDPELLFDGFVDQATLMLDKARDELEYTLISAFDYFFEASEGQRLNGQFHQLAWTGEKGLNNVTAVAKKIYWGALAPNQSSGSVVSTSVSGGVPSGSGGRFEGRAADRF